MESPCQNLGKAGLGEGMSLEKRETRSAWSQDLENGRGILARHVLPLGEEEKRSCWPNTPPVEPT